MVKAQDIKKNADRCFGDRDYPKAELKYSKCIELLSAPEIASEADVAELRGGPPRRRTAARLPRAGRSARRRREDGHRRRPDAPRAVAHVVAIWMKRHAERLVCKMFCVLAELGGVIPHPQRTVRT